MRLSVQWTALPVALPATDLLQLHPRTQWLSYSLEAKEYIDVVE